MCGLGLLFVYLTSVQAAIHSISASMAALSNGRSVREAPVERALREKCSESDVGAAGRGCADNQWPSM